MIEKQVVDHGDGAQMPIDVTHEALDAQCGARLLVVEGLGHLFLLFEVELVVFSTAYIMQTVSDPHQHIVGIAEALTLAGQKKAGVDNVVESGNAEDHLGGPDHRLDIAEPAFALLDVGLQQVAVAAEPLPALAAQLIEIADEFTASAVDKLVPEIGHELVEQISGAPDTAPVEQSNLKNNIIGGLLERFLDGPNPVPNLETGIPERIEY